jgi:uroporphyrinogen III methyltransferase/synthase
MRQKGKVYLVGAGPGEPGLITLKGLECLKKAEVVVYDRLVNPRLLEYASQAAELVYCGKSPKRHTLTQEEINLLLVKKAKSGKMVARLKGGDPFVFGRGAEEALCLSRHKIDFEVIPGVSAALAVPAYAGIPLTHRAYTSSVGIFTGHQDGAKAGSAIDWERISSGIGTLVFLMGVGNLKSIVNNLIRYGRPDYTPCCLIQTGTLPGQKSISSSLGEIVRAAKSAKITPPAILIAGDVVSLRDKLNWYESLPLFGKKILITRPHESAGQGRLLSLLEAGGASCLEMPAIEIKPLENYTMLDRAIARIDGFRWIIFTSQNAVRFFKQRMDCFKKDARVLKGVKAAVIGRMTRKALEDIGIKADLLPESFCQEGLIKGFNKLCIKGQNILIVRAREARDVLPKGLRKMGAKITIAPAYKAVMARARAPRGLKDIDLITFTSASGVKNFFKVFPAAAFRGLKKIPVIAAIGPITAREARKSGLKVAIEAKEYTFEGLAEAIVKYYDQSH